MSRTMFFLGACVAMTIPAAPADAMSPYRWKFRPVLAFANHDDSALLAKQRRIFAGGRAGLVERNIVVVWIVGNTVRTELGPRPGLTATQLRARFGLNKAGFRVILVGKDGGAKLSRSTPLTTATLFRIIDAMPMRRDEMRRKR